MERVSVHKVLHGQTLQAIAAAYCVGEWVLAQGNGLTEEVKAGQILRIPNARGNRYIARAGDEKGLLCGSKEKYEKKNGPYLYPGQRVVL